MPRLPMPILLFDGLFDIQSLESRNAREEPGNQNQVIAMICNATIPLWKILKTCFNHTPAIVLSRIDERMLIHYKVLSS